MSQFLFPSCQVLLDRHALPCLASFTSKPRPVESVNEVDFGRGGVLAFSPHRHVLHISI